MADLSGTIHAVTGANSGVGKATTRRLAAAGATVIMICRSRERGERARAEIREATGVRDLELRLADLSSLDPLRRLGEGLARELERLDSLVNNAGIYRADREITEDGLEQTMAVNHVAHYLLTRLLFGPLRAASGRVVTVSSEGHRGGQLRRAPLEAILRGRIDYRGLQAYSDSKLANVLFAFELARRAEGTGVTSTALHPGVLATRIWNQNRDLGSLVMRLFKPFMGSPEKGGEAVARLAADPELETTTGRYFKAKKMTEAAAAARDPELAAELWELTADLVGVDPAWPVAEGPAS